MNGFEWQKPYNQPSSPVEMRAIVAFERANGISLPEAVRTAYLTTDEAALFKDGQYCTEIVKDGERVGSFFQFDPLSRLPRAKQQLADWADDIYEVVINNVYPIAALAGGGWVCLDYKKGGDEPEVWEFDVNGTSFDNCFRKIANDFEEMMNHLEPGDKPS